MQFGVYSTSKFFRDNKIAQAQRVSAIGRLRKIYKCLVHQIVREIVLLYVVNFRTAPYYCKTNVFSQWQSIVFVIVFSIQELNA